MFVCETWTRYINHGNIGFTAHVGIFTGELTAGDKDKKDEREEGLKYLLFRVA